MRTPTTETELARATTFFTRETGIGMADELVFRLSIERF